MPAAVLRDTCGSGDMVTIGLIDWILRSKPATLTIDGILDGILSGQRLAAANCAFIGARGLARKYGAETVRAILDDRGVSLPEMVA
jgi:fructokinase